MTEPSNAGNPVPRGLNIRRVLLLDIALPVLTVILLERNGVAALPAYAVASVFPIVSMVETWLRQRSVDVIGIGVVVGIASGLLLGLATADPRFGLVRAAPGFALFGIACLISLFTARPLMFFVARASVAGGDAAKVALWNQRLSFPRFQQVMRRLTFVWGASALTESCVALACAFLLPGQIALIVERLLPVSVIGALLAWTRALQRRAPPIEPAMLSPLPLEETSHA